MSGVQAVSGGRCGNGRQLATGDILGRVSYPMAGMIRGGSGRVVRKEDVMGVLSREIAAYDRMRDWLETDYFGKWVVVHEEELVGSYVTFEDAADDAIRQFGRGPYLIRRVGAGPVTLPASVLYRPV